MPLYFSKIISKRFITVSNSTQSIIVHFTNVDSRSHFTRRAGKLSDMWTGGDTP